MRRAGAPLALLLLAASSPAWAGCPLCAGAGAPNTTSIWFAVGAFLVLPWILGAVVVYAVRKETRA